MHGIGGMPYLVTIVTNMQMSSNLLNCVYFTSVTTVENLVMICSPAVEIWKYSFIDQPISKHQFFLVFKLFSIQIHVLKFTTL